MCDFITTAAAALGLGGGTATAAGATAGAATAATAGAGLQGIGTLLSIGGTVYQGLSQYAAGRANAEAIENQRRTERQLNATQDQRERARFRSDIATQRAQGAIRGYDLDSPTAVYLGQTAAKELSFASQSVRQTGSARDTELSNTQRAYRGRATSGLVRGSLSAAGTWLTREPDEWQGLLA